MARIHKSNIRKAHNRAVRNWRRYFEAHPIDSDVWYEIPIVGDDGEEVCLACTDLTNANLCCGLNQVMALDDLHKMYVIGTKLREVGTDKYTYKAWKLWDQFNDLADEVCGLLCGWGFAEILHMSLV